jgi:hypothetical protein
MYHGLGPTVGLFVDLMETCERNCKCDKLRFASMLAQLGTLLVTIADCWYC